ncbi:MAG: sigma-70 family RNA polymerase sigma factor [Ferruginibacter sp.]
MLKDSLYDTKHLLLQVGEGNETAFRAIFDFFKGRFYAASLKMTHCRDTAEEIVQEVFVSLWMKRIQVAAAINPEGYLLTILHNCIYAHFRKLALENAMKKKIGEQWDGIDASPVEDILLAKENREMLESVISQLPPQQRIVYKLSKQLGLSREQIAGQLNISPHTVKNHLQQAVHFLRNYYKDGASVSIWLAILQCL